MPRYYLTKLSVEGFRGIKNEGDPLTLRFKPDAVNSIYAQNGIGKTSLFEAISYTIFGKLPKLDGLQRSERPETYYVNRFHTGGVGFVVLSGLVHLAYSLCLQRGYQVADLSVVYPVARGTGPMLSSLGAFLILGEMPSGRGVLGLLLVVAGIGLIATQGDLSAFRRPSGQSGVRWGIATGGLIASYTVVDAYAVKALGIAPVVLDWFSNLLRFFLLAPLVVANPRRAIEAMRGYWWIAIGVGLLSPLSYILVLAALTSGAPLSLVAPMREMSMMVGALLGMLILREKVGPWRLVGCGVLIAGVILLSAA